MEYRCVQCGFAMKTLFIQYSPGNIRLMKCENCKAVADEYIECEFMIVLIDLILHKPKAYRHVLYNVLNQKAMHSEGFLLKSIFGFLLLDGCFLLNKNEKVGASFMGFSLLVWRCQKVLMDVFVGNVMFFGVFLLATRIFLNMSIGVCRCKDILLAVLVSSYFKFFLVAMMVWEFPSSVIFIIELFVLSSNIVALKGVSAPVSVPMWRSCLPFSCQVWGLYENAGCRDDMCNICILTSIIESPQYLCTFSYR